MSNTVFQAAMATTLLNNTDDPLVAWNNQAAGTWIYGPFYNAKEVLRLAVNLTAIVGSAVVTILGYDQSSNNTWTILQSASLTAAGLTLLTVSPYIAAVANSRAQAEPPAWYLVQVAVTTGPVSGTIGAHGIGA